MNLYICIWYEKVVQIPWVYADTDDGTPNGNPKLDDNGNPMFTGYCMEFLHEMSKLLNFDYDVIPPTDNCRCFGEKQEDGTWTGLIGKMKCNINLWGFTDIRFAQDFNNSLKALLLFCRWFGKW